MRADVTPLRPDDQLDRAVELVVETDRLVLPVVDGTPQQRVIGIVRRPDITAAYLCQIQGTAHANGTATRT